MTIRHNERATATHERNGGGQPAALSDTELLAVLLQRGRASRATMKIARQLLATFGSLRQALNASPAELDAIHGIGAARSATWSRPTSGPMRTCSTSRTVSRTGS